jgi:hypothetical protein
MRGTVLGRLLHKCLSVNVLRLQLVIVLRQRSNLQIVILVELLIGVSVPCSRLDVPPGTCFWSSTNASWCLPRKIELFFISILGLWQAATVLHAHCTL